jgi:ribosomal protein S18 acetylase RimI-like enzyme
MKEVGQIQKIKIVILDRKLAEQNIDRLVELEDLIPMVDGDPVELLAESKGDRIMYGKWDHSLALIDGEKIIGFLMGYERKSEGNEQYPINSIYINTIAIDQNYQGMGLGKKLMKFFIDRAISHGLKFLEGEVVFSVQTNSAEFNNKVKDFYKSFGFNKRATKQYDNRTDNVYQLDVENYE